MTTPTPPPDTTPKPVTVDANKIIPILLSILALIASLLAIFNVTDPSSGSSAPPPSATPSSPSSSPSPTVTPASAAGLLPGIALKTVTGNVKVTTAGATLSNEHITGDLVIDAPASNVTVTNVQVDGGVGINTDIPSANGAGIVPAGVTLTHVDAHGLTAIGFNGLTVTASRFHDATGTISQLSRCDSDCGKGKTWPATNLTITGSVFEHLLPVAESSGYHLEDLHLMGVQGFTLSGDTFEATAPDQATWDHITAALTLERSFEGVANSGTITGCTFLGGSYYQAYLWGATSLTGNAFTTATSPDGKHASSPSYTGYGVPLPAFAQSGNTLDGKPLTLPTG